MSLNLGIPVLFLFLYLNVTNLIGIFLHLCQICHWPHSTISFHKANKSTYTGFKHLIKQCSLCKRSFYCLNINEMVKIKKLKIHQLLLSTMQMKFSWYRKLHCFLWKATHSSHPLIGFPGAHTIITIVALCEGVSKVGELRLSRRHCNTSSHQQATDKEHD